MLPDKACTSNSSWKIAGNGAPPSPSPKGHRNLLSSLGPDTASPGRSLVKDIASRSVICGQDRSTPKEREESRVGSRSRNKPRENWELEFTEIEPTAVGYKYLPVFEDIFLG